MTHDKVQFVPLTGEVIVESARTGQPFIGSARPAVLVWDEDVAAPIARGHTDVKGRFLFEARGNQHVNIRVRLQGHYSAELRGLQGGPNMNIRFLLTEDYEHPVFTH